MITIKTVTKILSDKQIEDLFNYFDDIEVCNTPPYAKYQIKIKGCTITAYNSRKVVFQGNQIPFNLDDNNISNNHNNLFPQLGSDEVGTGDYFGPVVVVSCIVEENNLTLLKKLKIQDSKQIKDDEILKIAPILMENLTYSKLIVDDKKYNQIHQTNNMNAIKAKLHNQALFLSKNKYSNNIKQIIVDQFTPEKSYYKYLINEKNIVDKITFETKAENKYLSVACASIIARYIFLKTFEKMCETYQFEFIKGAGDLVDIAGKKFIQKYGINELENVAKLHFKNTKKITEV